MNLVVESRSKITRQRLAAALDPGLSGSLLDMCRTSGWADGSVCINTAQQQHQILNLSCQRYTAKMSNKARLREHHSFLQNLLLDPQVPRNSSQPP